jgi:hypothetical protein
MLKKRKQNHLEQDGTLKKESGTTKEAGKDIKTYTYDGESIIKPNKNSKAFKAYEAGKRDFKAGLSMQQNPYVLAKAIGLSAWWSKGYRELEMK